eukprot:1423431-Pleurochrysis_carterae.AAC.2
MFATINREMRHRYLPNISGNIHKAQADFSALLNTRRDTPARCVGTILSDNAGEFTSREFTELLADNSIDATTLPPHVHALNGVAERAIRSIMELPRSNLTAASAPASFWDYAVEHAVDIVNRTSGPPGSRVISLYEVYSQAPSRLSYAIRLPRLRRKASPKTI